MGKATDPMFDFRYRGEKQSPVILYHRRGLVVGSGLNNENYSQAKTIGSCNAPKFARNQVLMNAKTQASSSVDICTHNVFRPLGYL